MPHNCARTSQWVPGEKVLARGVLVPSSYCALAFGLSAQNWCRYSYFVCRYMNRRTHAHKDIVGTLSVWTVKNRGICRGAELLKCWWLIDLESISHQHFKSSAPRQIPLFLNSPLFLKCWWLIMHSPLVFIKVGFMVCG